MFSYQASPLGLIPKRTAASSRVSIPKRAKDHLERWMRSAMRSRLEPFKRFVGMPRAHLDGVLAWTKTRLSHGAVEGMNNRIKSISHRSFGFVPPGTPSPPSITAVPGCRCPSNANCTFGKRTKRTGNGDPSVSLVKPAAEPRDPACTGRPNEVYMVSTDQSASSFRR